MKCQKCTFVQSDKNDLCARCFIDLRPYKQKNGLEITDTKSSYDHLLKELRNSVLLKPDQVKKILAEEPAKPTANTPANLTTTINAANKTIQHSGTNPAVTPIQKTPPMPQKTVVKQDSPRPIPQLTVQQILLAEKLFELTDTSLKGKDSQSFEIQLFDIVGEQKLETMRVLFETADEELLNPEQSVKYKAFYNKREAKVEANDLKAQLKKVVHAFENPSMTLKNLRAKDLSQSTAKFILNQATIFPRITASVVDLTIAFLLAFFIAVCLRFPLDPEFSVRLFSFQISDSDYQYLVNTTLFIVPLSLIVYFYIFYISLNTSIGEIATDIQTVNKDGSIPTTFSFFTKACLKPLTLAVLGVDYFIFKKRNLADMLCNTYIHKHVNLPVNVIAGA